MTGIELIVKERKEQIDKGYDIKHDNQFNSNSQLSYAAQILIIETLYPTDSDNTPLYWNSESWENMKQKQYKERLVIAGALIAAEIDRLNNQNS